VDWGARRKGERRGVWRGGGSGLKKSRAAAERGNYSPPSFPSAPCSHDFWEGAEGVRGDFEFNFGNGKWNERVGLSGQRGVCCRLRYGLAGRQGAALLVVGGRWGDLT